MKNTKIVISEEEMHTLLKALLTIEEHNEQGNKENISFIVEVLKRNITNYLFASKRGRAI